MKHAFRLALALLAIPALAQHAKLGELTVPDAFGVNIHFTTPQPGEMQMLADAGFKWVRMDFAWGGTERRMGEYDFSRYDGLLKSFEPHGIRALFILDYANRLYDDGLPPHTDEGRAAMAKWAAAAVTHFKGKGIVWEMWNEPNIAQFWKPKPNADDYAKLALEVAKSIRSAAPEELHVGPATSTIDVAFLETCFKAGLLNYWDAVSVHPYRQKDPETANEEYRKLRLLIAQYAPKERKIPILSGEWGYSAGWSGFDETRQGKYLPRELLTNLYNEIPISIWYDWHDDGQDPKEAEHHFGTVHNPYKKGATPVYDPKPAYVAMKTLTQQLRGFTYNKRLIVGSREEDYLLMFSRGDEVRLVAWTTGKPRAMQIPCSPGPVKMVSYLGDELRDSTTDEDGLIVTVDDTPLYVILEKPNAALQLAAAWPRVDLENPVKEYTMRNPLARRVSLRVDADTFEAGPGEIFRGSKPMAFKRRSRGDERSSELSPVEFRLGLGLRMQFVQGSTYVEETPFFVTFLPPDPSTISLLVRNPRGTALQTYYRLRLNSPPAAGDTFLGALPLAQGETGKLVPIQRTTPLGPRWEISGWFEFPDGTRMVIPKVGFRSAFPPAQFDSKSFHVAPDGDKSISSVQSLATGEPPEPIPAGVHPSIKLQYSFEPGWKFLRVIPTTDPLKKIDGNPRTLGIWLYGDGSGHRLRLRYVDSAGQTFQPSGPKIDWKGWQYVTISLNPPDLHHWGKGGGQVHPPIKWDTLLLLDNESKEKSAGEIWFAAPTLVE